MSAVFSFAPFLFLHLFILRFNVPLSHQQYEWPMEPHASPATLKHRAPVHKPCHLLKWILSLPPHVICWHVILHPCLVIVTFLIICPTVCPVIYLSSSISRLDSLSDSCLHKASLRSISLWSFLCSRMFSSLMCRSSSMYWARFSVSRKGNTEQMTSV